jgi:hypothetical protein
MGLNIDNFFAEQNRSMMGGWTIQAREKAVEEALKLEGEEKTQALVAIIDRLSLDQNEQSKEGAK